MPRGSLLQLWQKRLNKTTPKGEKDKLITDLAKKDLGMMAAILGDAFSGKTKLPPKNEDGKYVYEVPAFGKWSVPSMSMHGHNKKFTKEVLLDKPAHPTLIAYNFMNPDTWDDYGEPTPLTDRHGNVSEAGAGNNEIAKEMWADREEKRVKNDAWKRLFHYTGA